MQTRRKFHALSDGTVKDQSSIEYLSTFAVALVLLVIVVGIVSLLFFNNATPTSTYTPSSCYISPQINCQQMAVATNGIKTSAIIIFTNNLKQEIQFSSNSVLVYPTTSNKGYNGQCLPVNALPGSEVICNVTLTNYNPSVGTQLLPRFRLSYTECQGANCNPSSFKFSTVGSSTLYVSSGIGLLYPVKLVSNVPGGKISLNGVQYPSNTVVEFVKGGVYGVLANPPAGYAFSNWAPQGGVTVQQPSFQSTYSSATSNGTLTAIFIATTSSSTTVSTSTTSIPPTISTTSTISTVTTISTVSTVPLVCHPLILKGNPSDAGSESAFPANSVGCAAGTYVAGDQVTLTATPFSANVFAGWTGTQTGAGAVMILIMPSSAAVETANYVSTLSTFYCVGGETSSVTISNVYGGVVSSPGQVSWNPTSSSTNLGKLSNNYPIAIDDQACNEYNNYIYCVGGEDAYANGGAGQAYSDTYFTPVITNGVMGQWQAGDPYPNTIVDHACVVSPDGYMYCIDGGDDCCNLYTSVYSAQLSTGGITNWQQQASYPVPRGDLYCVEDTAGNGNSYIYCIGGDDSTGTKHSGVYYSQIVPGGSLTSPTGSGNAWQSTSTSSNNGFGHYPLAITGHRCIVYQQYIFCMVGNTPSSGNNGVNNVYSAKINNDGTLGTWTAQSSYPVTIDSVTCTINSGTIYCTAGGHENPNPIVVSSTTYYATISGGVLGAWQTAPSSSDYPVAVLDSWCAN